MEYIKGDWGIQKKEFSLFFYTRKYRSISNSVYTSTEITLGKDIFMLVENYAVGIISLKDNLIENLYILPNEQGKGYGTKLLLFAISKCKNESILWILDNNKKAYKLYSKHGFNKTGKVNVLSDSIVDNILSRWIEISK